MPIGRGGIGAKESATAILKGLENHLSRTSSSSIKAMNLVIFEQKVFDDSADFFKKKNAIKTMSQKNASTVRQSLRGALSADEGTVLCLNYKLLKNSTHDCVKYSLQKNDFCDVVCLIYAITAKICGVRIKVKKGDITMESVKGIVNTTNANMNLNGGRVSKWS